MVHLTDILLKSEYYLRTVARIESFHFITDGKWDWEHGLGHFQRVANYVVKILSQLNADEQTIELGALSALLHDVGLVTGEKKGHASRGSEMLEFYLKGMNLRLKEIEILKQAIADHSNGDNVQSNIGLALLLADKLDVTYHRTIHSTIQDQVNLEIQKICQVDVDISSESLTISYVTEGEIDVEMLFLAWDKMFAIPQKVADYLNLSFCLLINGEIQNLERNNKILKYERK